MQSSRNWFFYEKDPLEKEKKDLITYLDKYKVYGRPQ
jgi:hypothetical protein